MIISSISQALSVVDTGVGVGDGVDVADGGAVGDGVDVENGVSVGVEVDTGFGDCVDVGSEVRTGFRFGMYVKALSFSDDNIPHSPPPKTNPEIQPITTNKLIIVRGTSNQ